MVSALACTNVKACQSQEVAHVNSLSTASLAALPRYVEDEEAEFESHLSQLNYLLVNSINICFWFYLIFTFYVCISSIWEKKRMRGKDRERLPCTLSFFKCQQKWRRDMMRARGSRSSIQASPVGGYQPTGWNISFLFLESSIAGNTWNWKKKWSQGLNADTQ